MNNEVVASAIVSFNNSALAGANFFWSAVLLAPVFFAVWKMAPLVLAEFFPSRKNRDYNFAFILEILLVLWIVANHGNWETIRDGVGFLPYLNAVMLFMLSRDAAARLYEFNPKVPKWWKKLRHHGWIKIGAMLLVMAILAASTVHILRFMLLQIGSVFFGISAGYFGRKAKSPVQYTSFMMLAAAIGIMIQPEYARFGQLGRLSFLHLSFLALIFAVAALGFAVRNFAPADFIKGNHYKYIKWFMRLSTFLALILFVMTEAVPAFMGFGAGVLVTAWFAVKHLPRGTDILGLSHNLWAVMMILFGVISGMPFITVLGILAWKNNNKKSFFKNLFEVLR